MITREEQLCTFSVGGLRLGVDILRVQEVLRPRPMTRVPRAPGPIKGLMNLRGQIVTAIDLGQRLGLPAATPEAILAAMHVVIRCEGGVVSFLVDQISEVSCVTGGFEPAPSNTPPGFRALLRGVVPQEEGLLLVLDPDAVLGPTDVENDCRIRLDGRPPGETAT